MVSRPVSRRLFLGGVAGLGATRAYGNAPIQSLRPVFRPSMASAADISPDDLIAEAALGGRVAFAVADAQTGAILETRLPLLALPPASVTKVFTAAYALDVLGAQHRFTTRIGVTGPIENGQLQGDLWLIGGADPYLDTDGVEQIVRQLHENGLRQITGDIRVDASALPLMYEIDPTQARYAGYNPAIAGLNLNFNRLYFEWGRSGDDYDITLDARSETLRPSVDGVARMRIVDRADPVYTYTQTDNGQDHWTVARQALGNGGSRWLPVRRPAAYTAHVFRNLCRSMGIETSDMDVADAIAPDDITIIADHPSPPVQDLAQGMLFWSTNLTAEILGLRATQRRVGTTANSLQASGAEMANWAAQALRIRQGRFVDHSGLGGGSHVRPNDMVRALVSIGPNAPMRDLMRDLPLTEDINWALPYRPMRVSAKTGTLNFVSALAGFMTTAQGRELAFAIFCADTPRRAALTQDQSENPPGGRGYSRRARLLQWKLLRRWGELYM